MRRAVLHLRDARAAWAVPPWALAELLAAFDGWDVAIVEEAADGRGDGGEATSAALDAVRGTEVYIGFGLPRALFRAATEPPHGRLRWAHTATAGVGTLLHDELRASDVVLTNSAGIYAEPMAESALAAMLYFARGFDYATHAQHHGTWQPEPFHELPPHVRELAGATVGIIGFGGIGRALAWRATALDMRVIAVRRRAGAGPAGVELLHGEGALERLLEHSNYVVLSLPSTATTRGMIDASALARMRRDAVLINVARGDLVDESALAAALRDRRLRGAGLDVFTTEPLPPDSPLWTLPNVLITPHVSATSPRFWRRQVDLIVDNVRRYTAGQKLRNVVDKQAGY